MKVSKPEESKEAVDNELRLWLKPTKLPFGRPRKREEKVEVKAAIKIDKKAVSIQANSRYA